MNDNIGEQESCESNLGSSQINEPVLSINDIIAGLDELSVCL